MGEYTEVASANRGVRGTLRDDSDEEEVEVLGFINSTGRRLSPEAVRQLVNVLNDG